MLSLQEKLGARIQEIRKKQNITQEKLAEQVGLNVPNMSNLERGKKFVTAKTLEKIISVLNIEEKDLFDFSQFETKEKILEDINKILNSSNERELKYYYRMMNLYRQR